MELLQNIAGGEPLGSHSRSICAEARQLWCPALQCLGGTSADIYTCTPREPNSPIWKHQSSGRRWKWLWQFQAAGDGCMGCHKSQCEDMTQTVLISPCMGNGERSSMAPGRAHKRGEPALCLWGTVRVCLPAHACMQDTPSRAAASHLPRFLQET